MKHELPVFEISPLHGVGPVLLGSFRYMVREVLAATGFPLESSHGTSDYFCGSAIQTHCNADGNIWFIGVSQSDRFIASYQGVNTFSLAAADLFSMIAAADNSGPHLFTNTEYLFPGQIVTLWDADQQYDRQCHETRLVWAQIGIGDPGYAAAVSST